MVEGLGAHISIRECITSELNIDGKTSGFFKKSWVQ
jgi:hypothetical protein